MTEALQASAEMDQRNNEEVLRELMEHEACGHTLMHPNDSLELTRKILSELTLEQVNLRAKVSHHFTLLSLRLVAAINCSKYDDTILNACLYITTISLVSLHLDSELLCTLNGNGASMSCVYLLWRSS